MTDKEWDKRIRMARSVIEDGVRTPILWANEITGGERLAAVTLVIQRHDDVFEVSAFCTYKSGGDES